MTTHIAQPRFEGSMPAETLYQAADVATRRAQMLQSGIQEGMRTYLSMKQLRQQKDLQEQSIVSAKEQLAMSLLSKELLAGLEAVGPGSEAAYFMDNEPKFKQLYLFMAKGDEELADSMLEGTARSFQRSMSPTTAFDLGMIGYKSGETEETAPPIEEAKPVTMAPPAQPVTAAPAAAAPTIATTPTPAAKPTAAEVELSIPLPDTDEEFTSELVTKIASNMELMNAFRAHQNELDKANPPAFGVTSPTGAYETNLKYLMSPGNRRSFMQWTEAMKKTAPSRLVELINGEAVATTEAAAFEEAPTGIAQTIRDSGGTSALTATAASALERIAKSTDPAAETTTPKERAAISRSFSNTISVLDSEATRKFLASGGTPEQLARSAARLNEAMQDPLFAQYMRSNAVLAPADSRDYLNYMNQQRLIEQTLVAMGLQVKQAENEAVRLTIQQDTLEQRAREYEEDIRHAQAIETEAVKKRESAEQQAAVKAVISMQEAYDAAVVKEHTLWTRAGKNEDKWPDRLYELLSDPNNPIRNLRDQAAKGWAELYGLPLTYTTITVTKPFSILALNFNKENRQEQYQIPALPGEPTVSGRPAPGTPGAEAGVTQSDREKAALDLANEYKGQ